MSQIRLYIDEDAADRVLVRSLRRRGVDVLTVAEAQLESAIDEQQLIFATSQGRSIYSLNVSDFCRLHSEFLTAGPRGHHRDSETAIPYRREDPSPWKAD